MAAKQAAGLPLRPMDDRPTRICRCERVPSAHSYAEISVFIRDQQCCERYVAEHWYPPLGGPDRRIGSQADRRSIGQTCAQITRFGRSQLERSARSAGTPGQPLGG